MQVFLGAVMVYQGRTTTIQPEKGVKRVALIGMPNTGKSTFFSRIIGASAFVGNWPGMTVALLQAQVEMGGHLYRVCRLPGIYNLKGFSEDEAVIEGVISISL